jgi:hypothetical protein
MVSSRSLHSAVAVAWEEVATPFPSLDSTERNKDPTTKNVTEILIFAREYMMCAVMVCVLSKEREIPRT